MMKVAIFHDFFDEIGGAEITLLVLAKALNATIVTTNIDKQKISELGFDSIKFVSLGGIPNVKYLKQFAAQLRFLFCDFSREFDFFIFGGFCSISAAIKHKNNLWYCFSPRRGIYDLRYHYFSKYNIPAQALINLLMLLDKFFARKLKTIIAPSQNVRSRIRKYYGRKSDVVYHPVPTKNFHFKKHEGYWLCATRIDSYKRLELQLAAFAKLSSEKLVIVGTHSPENKGYFLDLLENCPRNVDFVGGVYDPMKLSELYSKCKGFIVTSLNEDFGMNVVEAMASGKPVIAPDEGGYRETVVDGVTGVLIPDITAGSLSSAVEQVSRELEEKPDKYSRECMERASEFDEKIFIRKIKEILDGEDNRNSGGVKGKSSSPKVSVVIPTYYSERTLRACLESVLNQTYDDYEVVVVYTVCGDETLSIIKDFAERDDRVRYVTQEKVGRGPARNNGIRASKGEIIVSTDSDCVVPSDWLQKLVEPIQKDGEVVVQGHEIAASDDFLSKLIEGGNDRHVQNHVKKGGYIDHIDTKNMAIKKDLLNELGGFNNTLGTLDDFELKIRLKKAGIKIRFLPDLRVKHNHRQSLFLLIKQKAEQGYWASIVYQLHKDFFDSEKKKDNVIQTQYLSYLLLSPFVLIKKFFEYGPSNCLFIIINSLSWLCGNFIGRLNKTKAFKQIKEEEKE